MRKKVIIIHCAIWAFAVLIRLMLIPTTPILQSDEMAYHQLALSVGRGEGYHLEGQTYSRPPFYPIFVAGIYHLFGAGNVKAVFILQALFGGLMCNIVYEIARRFFGSATAFLSALMMLANIPMNKSGSLLLTEGLFTLCLLSAFFFMKQGRIRDMVLSGFLLALASLTKSVALLLPVVGILYLFLVDGSRALKKSSVLLGVFLISLLPFTVRNFLVYQTIVPISTQGGYAFYSANHPIEGRYFGYNVKDDRVAYARSLNSETKMSHYLFKETIQDIQKDPKEFLRLETLKFFYFWAPFDWEILGEGRYHLLYGFAFPFFLLGVSWAKNKRLLLLLPIVYFQVMALIFYGSPRFRLPIEPFLIIFSAFGVVQLFRRLPVRSVSIMLSILLFVHLALFTFPGPLKKALAVSLEAVGVW